MLREPEYARIDFVLFGSPLEIRKIVRGSSRALIVVGATAATMGTVLVGVNEALDQVSGTIERVERIYEQVRDFAEEDPVQREETGVLRGRHTEPSVRGSETRIERLRSR